MTARHVQIIGDVAYVPLTRGYEAIIDAADAHLASGFNWGSLVKRRGDGDVRTVYALRRGSPDKRGARPAVYLHRVIMDAPAGSDVDHIDGNGLNNRRSNLRVASRSENLRNHGMRPNNTSGFKGVSWHNTSEKWQVHIRVDGKQKMLGLFADIQDAAAAYAKASKELHGEFGRTA